MVGKYINRSVFLVVMTLSACIMQETEQSLLLTSKTFDFNENADRWQQGYADLPNDGDPVAHFALDFGHRQIADGSKALHFSAINQNNDIFFYIKHKLTGLQPGMLYTITFEIELAKSEVSYTDQWAKEVFIKAGAMAAEPKSVVDNGILVMNIDKGNHKTDGADMLLLGNLTSQPSLSTVRVSNGLSNTPIVARSNAQGELWLAVGADILSGGQCVIDFKKVSLVLTTSY